jgi:hypothetical protein
VFLIILKRSGEEVIYRPIKSTDIHSTFLLVFVSSQLLVFSTEFITCGKKSCCVEECYLPETTLFIARRERERERERERQKEREREREIDREREREVDKKGCTNKFQRPNHGA